MKLFNLNNYKLEISEEAYLLKPFKDLWDRDKSKKKDRAFAEVSYVFFMEDFRSDFLDILDEKRRSTEVKKNLAFPLPKGWREDKYVKAARDFYKNRENKILSLLFLKDAKIGVNKIREFYRKVDLLETDKSGKPIYNIAQLASVIEKSSGILSNLSKLEEMVKKDLQSESKVRGEQKKSVFEDGI